MQDPRCKRKACRLRVYGCGLRSGNGFSERPHGAPCIEKNVITARNARRRKAEDSAYVGCIDVTLEDSWFGNHDRATLKRKQEWPKPLTMNSDSAVQSEA